MHKPEQVKISITRPDGGVTIMAFVTKSFLPHGDGKNDIEFQREATAENINAEIKKANLACASWRIIDDSEIPEDRTFRDAWKDDSKIFVDMQKAREIHKANLRKARRPLLVSLDFKFMRALEAGDTKKQAEIAAQKQALRDVTAKPEIEAAQTPDALKAITV